MTQGASLSCEGPITSKLHVVEFERTPPKRDEVEIMVEAASVNPIDVQRSKGYGRT